MYVNAGNTGTDPLVADTDGDGINDGDETLGTLGGLDLPGLGFKPLKTDKAVPYGPTGAGLGKVSPVSKSVGR